MVICKYITISRQGQCVSSNFHLPNLLTRFGHPVKAIVKDIYSMYRTMRPGSKQGRWKANFLTIHLPLHIK